MRGVSKYDPWMTLSLRHPALKALLLVAPLCVGLVNSGCVATVGDVDLPRVPGQSLAPASDSALGRVFVSPGDDRGSRFAPMDRGDEGLDVRLALAASAESSIDAQSYLWHEDTSGSLLLNFLLEAADRGVRVRLMIDGFRLESYEDFDRGLDLHPNLEIRAFNPTLHRSGIWERLEVIGNLGQLDHRMHNKLFLVDGVAGVFGGRNVGDEYFGISDEANFRDMDLLASGPVIGQLALSFDEFWNSEWAIPIRDITAPVAAEQQRLAQDRARESLRAMFEEDRRVDKRRSLQRQGWLGALERAQGRMVSGQALVLHDAANVESDGSTSILARAFEAALGGTHGDVLIVSAYLVPDETFLEHVREHVHAGERVRILTNSYVSTNQPLAHTFYASARHDLLAAGAELYELRGDAWSHVHHRSPGSQALKLGLHAKSSVFGDAHVLVGSMNVDPRSMTLNTELGVLIESPELAVWVRSCLEREFAARNAWRVELNDDGSLRWTTQGMVLHEEPQMSAGEHLREWFLRLLPLKGEV